MKRTVTCKAPFDLRYQNSFFGGWPVITDTDEEFGIAITFPVEGWEESAAVVVTQNKSGEITAECYGAKDSDKATRQALACLSLDVDDSDWEDVGKRDAIIAGLQKKYQYLRPILFHSPYEAAAGFIIGQRISVKQRQALQKKISEQHGEKIQVGEQEFAAFPSPQVLLNITEFQGLSEVKIDRLHGIANAALEGKLDRVTLLNVSEEAALEELQKLKGLGPFYASGILYRGAGIVDGITDDNLTKYAVQQAYGLDKEPTQEEVMRIAEKWQPYRMWCEVLIHIWLRREVGLPKR